MKFARLLAVGAVFAFLTACGDERLGFPVRCVKD